MNKEKSLIYYYQPFASQYCGLDSSKISTEIRLKSTMGKPMIPLVLGTNLENLASLSTITETAISNYAGFADLIKPTDGLSPTAMGIPDIPTQGVGPDDFDCPDNFWGSIDDDDWFEEPVEGLGNEFNQGQGKTNIPVQGGDRTPCDRYDTYAYYRSAHACLGKEPPEKSPEKYGIFYIPEAFYELCKYINSNHKNFELKKNLLLLVFYHIYAHEVCHAWVEDIVSMVNFKSGLNDPLSNCYRERIDRFKPFEESLCETAAYAWSRDCLAKSFGNDISRKRSLFTAYKKWHEDSVGNLSGYSRYRKLKTAPVTQPAFIKGICRLVAGGYFKRQKNELCRKVIEDFFGGKINRGSKEKFKGLARVPTSGTAAFAHLADSAWLKIVPRGVDENRYG
jgi:hypothetical protein